MEGIRSFVIMLKKQLGLGAAWPIFRKKTNGFTMVMQWRDEIIITPDTTYGKYEEQPCQMSGGGGLDFLQTSQNGSRVDLDFHLPGHSFCRAALVLASHARLFTLQCLCVPCSCLA